jgi:hypothetical protein
MCGYDNLIFGAAIPGLGGGDGILPGDARLSTSVDGGDKPENEHVNDGNGTKAAEPVIE